MVCIRRHVDPRHRLLHLPRGDRPERAGRAERCLSGTRCLSRPQSIFRRHGAHAGARRSGSEPRAGGAGTGRRRRPAGVRFVVGPDEPAPNQVETTGTRRIRSLAAVRLIGVQIEWQQRAAQAETAVLARHLRRFVALPGTRLGVVGWPADLRDRSSIRWNFWWQAPLLDCLVDSWLRRPDPVTARLIGALIKSIKLRNVGRFTNAYYDDMAWMGLALKRAEAVGAGDAGGISQIVTRILDAWSPPVGGIPWRVGDDYFNAPANGPAAILLARVGFTDRAERTADWMDRRLRVPGSDLIADGFYAGQEPRPVYYTYVQGVVLGAEVELAGMGRSRARVHRLVVAVDSFLADDGVLRGNGGAAGGLFAGILARSLALVSMGLPGDEPADRDARATAARLVLASAEAAWLHSAESADGPLFGPAGTEPAALPTRGDHLPERDLSVQLSGWMLMEAAAAIARSSARRP